MIGRPAGPRPPRAADRACARRRVILALAAALVPASVPAQTGSGPPAAGAPLRTGSPPFEVRASVRPAVAGIGERVLYRGWVLRPEGRAFARWLHPDSGKAFTWGEPRVWQGTARSGSLGRGDERRRGPDAAGRHPLGGWRDTLFIEIPLQVFAPGSQIVPGIRLELDDGRGPRVHQLPTVTLEVTPVLTAADSNADYRQLHGPLAAPWWEQVPWRWVVLGLVAVATAIALTRWWRRRRRTEAPAVAAAPATLDPVAEALAALAALRAQHLPEGGRFAEHAFRLGQILRRYLEGTTGATRPGDTTPELVGRLRGAGLEPEDLTRFSGLLRVWDRVKFAREAFSLEEAERAERAVDAFLRRPTAGTRRVA